MELGVQQLHLNDISEPLPEDGTDKHQMLQVHDYRSVSFFRMDPAVKAASKETISVFSMAYPELLAHKYFVNVPAIMGWMFGAMKLFLAPATLRKFHPMTSGTTLSTELKSIAQSLPQEYGGSGSPVQEGLTVTLAESTEAAKVEAAEEPKSEAVVAPVEAPAQANEAAVAEPQTVDIPVRPKEEEAPVEAKEEEAPVEAKKEEAPAPVEPEAKAEPETKAEEAKSPAEETKQETEEKKETEQVPVAADGAPKEAAAAPKETEAAETAQPEKSA
ncbi:hypothetical protein THARTR1_09774 [Trichoderma harzianum]|uniref:Phosphatidylinositol transfer protein SFH5 n=1 Tax=Trichoderma harzianum TaxID=5544 RepID=A0A2K0TV96_TRIHA|nr:hypothetical protein THARTR1_09774 [Trichoderma harzianum]